MLSPVRLTLFQVTTWELVCKMLGREKQFCRLYERNAHKYNLRSFSRNVRFPAELSGRTLTERSLGGGRAVEWAPNTGSGLPACGGADG